MISKKLQKHREQMEADMKTRKRKRRRGRLVCKKVGGTYYWFRNDPAKEKKLSKEAQADKLRDSFMPQHGRLIHAALRSKKQLTKEQQVYGRILAASKITAGKGGAPVDETPDWIKDSNSFQFKFSLHGYIISALVPVALVGSSSVALDICRRASKFARRITREWTVNAGSLTPPSPHHFVVAKMSIRKYINREIYKHLTK